MAPAILISLIVVAMVLVVGFIRRSRVRARQSALRAVLDAADALEDRLRSARSEIEAVAGDEVNPVRAAMEDLLQQRLWLRDHADHARIVRLNEVRAGLDAARQRLEQQLQQIKRARSGR